MRPKTGVQWLTLAFFVGLGGCRAVASFTRAPSADGAAGERALPGVDLAAADAAADQDWPGGDRGPGDRESGQGLADQRFDHHQDVLPDSGSERSDLQPTEAALLVDGGGEGPAGDAAQDLSPGDLTAGDLRWGDLYQGDGTTLAPLFELETNSTSSIAITIVKQGPSLRWLLADGTERWGNSLAISYADARQAAHLSAYSIDGGQGVKELDARRCGLFGPLPQSFLALGALQQLDLSSNSLDGPLPAALGGLRGLRRLRLNANLLRGALPPELGQLQQLEVLDLGSNELEGNLPPSLSGLVELRQLHLGQTLLSGPLPPWIGELSQLEQLFLYNTKLDGPLPRELGRLQALRALIITGSPFSGPIIRELGQLPALDTLVLSSTALDGYEAGTFARADALRTLDLNDLPGLSQADVSAIIVDLHACGQRSSCQPKVVFLRLGATPLDLSVSCPLVRALRLQKWTISMDTC